MKANTNCSSAVCDQPALTDWLERVGITDTELAQIYNEANGIYHERHNQVSMKQIFAAMRAAMAMERKACWNEINAWIKPGELYGDGCDQTAQRNGLILASNIVMGRIMRSNFTML